MICENHEECAIREECADADPHEWDSDCDVDCEGFYCIEIKEVQTN